MNAATVGASTQRLSSLSRSLLVPLVARAHARELGFGRFDDPWARWLLGEVDVDVPRLLRHRLTLWAVVRRAQLLDDWCRAYIASHPDALGVSLGAGLCTRFQRVDNGRIHWVDLDLPEVIALRRSLVLPEELARFATGERHRAVAASLTSSGWFEQLGWRAGQPIVLLSEGVLLYLPPSAVKGIFDTLAERITTGGTVLFDYAHPWLVSISRWLPIMRTLDLQLSWGVGAASSLAARTPGLRLAAQASILWPFYRAAKLDIRATASQTV